jgi:hypothetical protein
MEEGCSSVRLVPALVSAEGFTAENIAMIAEMRPNAGITRLQDARA